MIKFNFACSQYGNQTPAASSLPWSFLVYVALVLVFLVLVSLVCCILVRASKRRSERRRRRALVTHPRMATSSMGSE